MKLFFREYGQGEPIIILHGLFGLSDNWVTIARRIAEKFHVFIPDQRNHGQSPHSDTFNYFALSADLQEFIEENQLRNPVLIGHSMGGKVAMQFALESAKMVKKLVVIDISPGSYPVRSMHMDMVNAMLSVDLSKMSSRSEIEKIIAEKIEDERTRLFIMKNLYRINLEAFAWRPNLKAIVTNLEDISEQIAGNGKFEKPTLFIKGEKSDYVLDKDEELIYKLFPFAEIKTIEKAGHWVHADAPVALCHILSNFLGRECLLEG
jgi:pimeloyl-ACP methyl ester carboxylesterase